MDSLAISLGGLRASTAMFERSASNIVRATMLDTQAAGTRANATAEVDFARSIVDQKLAVSSFRANVAAIKAEDAMTKATLDLIC
ncbi:MAG TPA: hypothetical protein VMU08_09240 [Rhizomicrobium sp.]|nr:hypothetical protein [Rhizomicrobium sp.]